MYVRETGSVQWSEVKDLNIKAKQFLIILLPVKYKSPTGHHEYQFPIFYRVKENENPLTKQVGVLNV
ncbi:hypothetical protein [Metabacillus fastidiosus]|uniref:hypothetical protein n=1 Tax=Metabacillus fastidiosus TaxID=1458 RepID=UPI003D29BAE3